MGEDNQLERYPPGPPALRPRPPALPAVGEAVEAEEPADLRAYWSVLGKRRWTVLVVFFVVFTLALVGTLKQTPLYRARALLEIEKENPDILTMQDLFRLERVSDTYLETQYEILQSESLARRVMDQLGLDQREEFRSPGGWWPWGEEAPEPAASTASQVFAVEGASAGPSDPRAYQRALERFRERLGIEPIKRSRLVAVSFESADPELAAQVVRTLAANYIEQHLEARWEATQRASEWLSQQLGEVKGRLERAEDELQRYAREQGLLFLESGEGDSENIVNERLRQLQEELTRAQALLAEKEAFYRLVEGGDYGALPGVFDSQLMQELTVQVAELRRQRAELAATFTEEYPRVQQLQSQIEELGAVLAAERARAARRITNDYLAAVRRESLLRQAFQQQQAQAERVAERSIQYNILKREVETNQQLYDGLLQRLKEAGVGAGLKASNIRIVDSPQVPQKPARPNLPLNLALGFVLGLGLGVGAAFLQEYLDNTLKSDEDVERFLRLPTLALVPSVESLNGHHRGWARLTAGKYLAAGKPSAGAAGSAERAGSPGWLRIDTDTAAHSALLEAFRSLRTSVLLSTAERPPRSLLVCSAQAGEGKTTISINLGISLAQSGQRVLLVDGDMRRPCVHKAFGLGTSGGLVSYLTGQREWAGLVEPTPVAGLEALPCGPVPPNPAELLSSERTRTLLAEALRRYQFVLFDSPPVLHVADSRILASLVEGAVLVVQGGTTPGEVVRRAQAQIDYVGGNVIGVVLNNLDVRSGHYYYDYYYRYDYGGSGEPESPGKR